jgi:hypothetical protein
MNATESLPAAAKCSRSTFVRGAQIFFFSLNYRQVAIGPATDL